MSIKQVGIRDLLKKHFYIPSYQRGYRWGKQEIFDLLNDIFDNKDNRYCLQPLIIKRKKEEESFEVIDGQQRLTTIYILLSYLKEPAKCLGLLNDDKEPLFSIEYETRKDSKEFLQNILNTTETNIENIDFYNMSNAIIYVKKWFDKKRIDIPGLEGIFARTLLEKDNIFFLWYPLTQEDTENCGTFITYNQGKIELTNSELIKAKFFLHNNNNNDTNKEEYQAKIGLEWDNIEKDLRLEDLWAFFNPNKKFINHIEYIFYLIAMKYESLYESCSDLKLNHEIDKKWVFYVFDKLISENNNPKGEFNTVQEFLWDEIKTYHRIFIEWYNNNEYYNLIGFLLQIKSDNIQDILNSYINETKDEFIKCLKRKIKEHFNNITLEELSYEDDKDEIKNILLLFNVISTMNADMKFPFYKYANKKQIWSLEHIHAQNSQNLKQKQKIDLLERQKETIKYIEVEKEYEELKQSIDKELEILEEKDENEDFDKIQLKIFIYTSNPDDRRNSNNKVEPIHSIKNLALLDKDSNSALQNDIFPEKRNHIKELDKNGKFIPICTKNVFLKYYSESVDQNLYWSYKDMEDYLKEIKKTLNSYLGMNTNE